MLIVNSIDTQLGFKYHHAKEDYVMMTLWLPEGSSTLPLFASHYVGVGAVVINAKNEILVVKEANGPITSIWKVRFPSPLFIYDRRTLLTAWWVI